MPVSLYRRGIAQDRKRDGFVYGFSSIHTQFATHFSKFAKSSSGHSLEPSTETLFAGGGVFGGERVIDGGGKSVRFGGRRVLRIDETRVLLGRWTGDRGAV